MNLDELIHYQLLTLALAPVFIVPVEIRDGSSLENHQKNAVASCLRFAQRDDARIFWCVMVNEASQDVLAVLAWVNVDARQVVIYSIVEVAEVRTEMLN